MGAIKIFSTKNLTSSGALDYGINFIDTSRVYMDSETNFLKVSFGMSNHLTLQV